jgi:hypothetical protein
MMGVSVHTYGGVPVPYTVSWSAEDAFRVDHCRHAGTRAICQSIQPGQGKPQFGKPHSQRQREAIADDLCDLCGRTLRNKTKVSLSHARPRMNGAEGIAILQVEPLLHRGCAATSLRHCPSLKRDIAAGTAMIRQVTQHRVQLAIVSPEFVGTYVPGYVAAPSERIVGHAKVELLRWVERDSAWLLRSAEARP